MKHKVAKWLHRLAWKLDPPFPVGDRWDKVDPTVIRRLLAVDEFVRGPI